MYIFGDKLDPKTEYCNRSLSRSADPILTLPVSSWFQLMVSSEDMLSDACDSESYQMVHYMDWSILTRYCERSAYPRKPLQWLIIKFSYKSSCGKKVLSRYRCAAFLFHEKVTCIWYHQFREIWRDLSRIRISNWLYLKTRDWFGHSIASHGLLGWLLSVSP